MDETTNVPEKKGNSMMVFGVIVVFVIVGIAVVLMRNRSQSTQTTATVEQAQPADTTATEPSPNSDSQNTLMEDSTVKTFNIEAGSFYYKPNEIRVKKGDTVKIVINSADMMHDFNIDELNVKMPITKSGETNTVELTVDTVGEFEFYCSVGQHRANGQVGTLIVEE